MSLITNLALAISATYYYCQMPCYAIYKDYFI